MPETLSARILLISAVASGQGKTSVTAALARKLRQSGQRVRVFKTGPDFLDPMLLERACGSAVQTLDLWMVSLEQCRNLLAQAAREADVILIEGVMGLYDGDPSSADLARAFGVPVAAVIDASAMAQTAGAVAQGLRDYGPVELAGVIANRIASPGHASMVAAALRNIPLLATLPRQERGLPERHLGLVQPAEVGDVEALLDLLAAQLQLDESGWHSLPHVSLASPTQEAETPPLLAGKQIAIARDAAFAFLYPANLDCLRRLGAKLAFFSPLNNEGIPAESDALYLPGGYPELHAATLADARIWRDSVRTAHGSGLPIWAECGGMMALTESLTDQAGLSWPMAGLLPAKVSMQTRLAGLGSQAMTMPQGVLRGHTFHYSRLTKASEPHSYTSKHPSQVQGEAVYRHGSLTASYFHAYFPSCPAATAALFSRDGKP